MVPYDDFTPHGYLDNPYHSWKLNPSGVLRSLAPLGMGWHMPNLGSYVRNQFQYTAHLSLALKIGDRLLFTPEDFARHGCTIVSHVHTKNRFEYTCTLPDPQLVLTARYFLINEHALGCIVALSGSPQQTLPVTCYLLHQHTHNPYTSRLWEHGLYMLPGPQEGTSLLGLASEGDVFLHGAQAATLAPVHFAEPGYVTTLAEAAQWAARETVAAPAITQAQQETGWQARTVILPCTFSLEPGAPEGPQHILNAVLTRGVSQDHAWRQWQEAIEEIALADAQHRADDEEFWSHAPQLSGDWPEHWRRGLIYDLETLRMTIRPSLGEVKNFWDGMQVQAPRLVLAEAALDTLFLSYADPALAAEVILGHFETAPRPNLPCMREDGSYNMVADDGQICGTAPEWGFPLWCCDSLFRRTGDLAWLSRLYPAAAAYLTWWLEQRRDSEGWSVYNCSWESGQDVSSRFGPQQTGGTIIEHVRPVDLQASMAQGATILARWATLLAQAQKAGQHYTAEAEHWQQIADEFTVKTRQMWHDGWFRDYDATTGEWSALQDTMHFAPIFCGAATPEQIEQLKSALAEPPAHSGWAPLSWPPVMLTLIGAVEGAKLFALAAEHAARFIDASYSSIDRRELDEQGGLPGVTREYLRHAGRNEQGEDLYANAGIEGYGWGAISVHLLIRSILGLREQEAGKLTVGPMLPKVLRKQGAVYTVKSIQWGSYALDLEITIGEGEQYRLVVVCTLPPVTEDIASTAEAREIRTQRWEWKGRWGDFHPLPASFIAK